MGVDESLLEYSLENQCIGNKVIFVNIKNNDVYLNNKKRVNLKNINKFLDLPKFPEKIENLLNKKLDEIRQLNNNALIIENLRYIFCEIMVVILNDYLEHCFIIEEDIIFNNFLIFGARIYNRIIIIFYNSQIENIFIVKGFYLNVQIFFY